MINSSPFEAKKYAIKNHKNDLKTRLPEYFFVSQTALDVVKRSGKKYGESTLLLLTKVLHQLNFTTVAAFIALIFSLLFLRQKRCFLFAFCPSEGFRLSWEELIHYRKRTAPRAAEVAENSFEKHYINMGLLQFFRSICCSWMAV